MADDSYHLYKEDVQLLKNLGVSAYRMSISWSRVFPDGTGKPNAMGLDYYKRVIDELHQNGIEPYVTLFHWDLPASFPHGWQSRDTSKAFGDMPRMFHASWATACGITSQPTSLCVSPIWVISLVSSHLD